MCLPMPTYHFSTYSLNLTITHIQDFANKEGNANALSHSISSHLTQS